MPAMPAALRRCAWSIMSSLRAQLYGRVPRALLTAAPFRPLRSFSSAGKRRPFCSVFVLVALLGFTLTLSTALPPHTVIKLPSLSPTMSAGNLKTWLVKVGCV